MDGGFDGSTAARSDLSRRGVRGGYPRPIIFPGDTLCAYHAPDLWLRPENFLLWHPTCHFYDERVEELIEKFAEEKEERVSLFHLYGHSYELDYGKGWQYIEALFRRLTAIEGACSMSYAEIYELFGTNKKGGGG